MHSCEKQVKVLVAQSCPTLCDPVDCSPPGSSVHGILQARMLEWVAVPFSRGSSQPRGQAPIFCIAGRFFTIWATKEECERRKHNWQAELGYPQALLASPGCSPSPQAERYECDKLLGQHRQHSEPAGGHDLRPLPFPASFHLWRGPHGCLPHH